MYVKIAQFYNMSVNCVAFSAIQFRNVLDGPASRQRCLGTEDIQSLCIIEA